jgi:hypothetical protein
MMRLIPVPFKGHLLYIGPHWPVLLAGLALLAGLSCLLDVYVLTVLRTPALVVQAATLVLYLALGCCSDPGVVTETGPPDSISGHCGLCGTVLARGVRHCSDCDLCIAGYDHHCPWVGKCIGSNNIHLFFIYVTAVCLTFIVAILGVVVKGSES